MKNLPAALGWLGLALLLLPLALICGALIVVIALAEPMAGVIFGLIVFAIGRALLAPKKGSPE